MTTKKETAEKNTEKVNYTDELATYFANQAGIRPRGRETVSEQDEQGAFVRQPNYFTDPITLEDADKDNYIIYWSPGCNWSNRPVIARDILGLQDVIKDYQVAHAGEKNIYGWGFPKEEDFKDPYTGVHFLSELYKNANPEYKGRSTTPTFVNIAEKKGCIK